MKFRKSKIWSTDLISDAEAQAAAAVGVSIVLGWPGDPDERLRAIVTDLDRLPHLKVFAADFDHYGSGYASFVEVKMTRRDDSLVRERGGGVETCGFGLLLNRLAPMAVLQIAASEWRAARSEGSTVPSRRGLTNLPVAQFPESVGVVEPLQKYGYELASLDAMRAPIAPGVDPLTVLEQGPYAAFDAWYHWCD